MFDDDFADPSFKGPDARVREFSEAIRPVRRRLRARYTERRGRGMRGAGGMDGRGGTGDGTERIVREGGGEAGQERE
eukprot:4555988-Pyramimonas_sp.AAC.1